MTNKNTLILITEIKKLNPRLNEFEQKFIEVIEHLANRGFKLSKKQGNCLEKIYRDKIQGIYQKRGYVQR